MKDTIVLGVDIGGSHITATLVDLKTGNRLDSSEVREPVNAKGTANEIISLWANVINSAFSKQNVPVKKIGIAMPGPFDYNKGIAWMKNQDKYDSLYGLNVKNLLAESLHILPEHIKFLNDAESFLKGEVFSGAAKGMSKAIGLTLGTGLGSARFRNNNVEDADLWHTPFLDGIAEDYLSTRWFLSRYLSLTGNAVTGVKELLELAGKDADAVKVFNEFGYHLALFLKDIIKNDKPQIVILGGNISNAFPFFSEELNRQLGNGTGTTLIKKALLGEGSSLIGAASCWNNVDEQLLQNVRA
jgi:glucokinase